MRVGVSEARSRSGALLKRVSSGETVLITRRGRVIAKLVPEDFRGRVDLKKVVEEIRELRKGASLGNVTIRKLIDDGRRMIDRRNKAVRRSLVNRRFIAAFRIYMQSSWPAEERRVLRMRVPPLPRS